MTQSDHRGSQYSCLNITKDNVGLHNRPLLLARQLQAQKEHDQGGRRGEQSQVEHLFRLEFDQTTGIPPCWVDTKTLNFFNTLRDNIFASSSHHDRLMLQPRSQTPTDQKSKKKKPDSG